MKWIRCRHKKASIKNVWVLLNLLIMFVPVAISLFVYISLYQIIVHTVNQDSISLLRQVQQETDARIADLQRVGIQVSSNAYVKSVLDVADVSDPLHYYNLSKIETDLFSYQTANGYIDSIVINFHSSGKLVSSMSIYDNALLDTGLMKETIMSSTGWEQVFKIAGSQRLVYIKNAMGSGTGKMMYIQPLSSGGPNDYSAVLAITLKSDMLTGGTNKSGLLGDGLCYIIDSDNNVVTADANKSQIPDIPFSRLQSGKTITYTGDSGKMLVITFNSQYPSWKYVFCVPVQTILQEAQFVRTLIAFGVLLCLLAGGLTAIFVTRRNYRPLSDLIRDVSENKLTVPLHAGNEFSLLRESFAKSYERYQEAVRKLDLQETDLRQNFLTKLMKGALQGSPELFLKKYRIEFRSDAFLVLLFYIQNYGDLDDSGQPDQEVRQMELARFAIVNVVGELLEKTHTAYFTDVDGMLGCLVNLDESREERCVSDVERACSEGYLFLHQNTRLDYYTAVGLVHRGFEGIADSFSEALDALEYRMFNTTEKVVLYEKTIDPARRYLYSLKEEIQLDNCVKAGDKADAVRLVQGIFDSNFNGRKMPLSEAKSLLYDLNGTAFKLVEQVRETYGEQAIGPDTLSEFFRPLPLDKAEQAFLSLIGRLCDIVVKNRVSRSGELCVGVVEYIEQHYPETTLSVSGISDQFGITSSYLSRIFKETRGLSIPDQIAQVRIRLAKELLSQTRESLGAIAEQVGYIDSSAFIRTFKKYEGITPGKYREIR